MSMCVFDSRKFVCCDVSNHHVTWLKHSYIVLGEKKTATATATCLFFSQFSLYEFYARPIIVPQSSFCYRELKTRKIFGISLLLFRYMHQNDLLYFWVFACHFTYCYNHNNCYLLWLLLFYSCYYWMCYSVSLYSASNCRSIQKLNPYFAIAYTLANGMRWNWTTENRKWNFEYTSTKLYRAHKNTQLMTSICRMPMCFRNTTNSNYISMLIITYESDAQYDFELAKNISFPALWPIPKNLHAYSAGLWYQNTILLYMPISVFPFAFSCI